MVPEELVLLHDEGTDLSGRHACECSLELGRRSRLSEMECQSQAAGGNIHLAELNLVDCIPGIGQVAYPGKTGDRLLEHLEALGHELPIDRREAGEVIAWPRQTTTSPVTTGSLTVAKTTGSIVPVRFIARAAGVLTATITSKGNRASSAALESSVFPGLSHRNSMAIFFPSVQLCS